MDRSGVDGVVGTVAGDDTIMVAVDDEFGVDDVCERLAALAGLEVRPKERVRAVAKNRK